MNSSTKIILYGTPTCIDCIRSKKFLDDNAYVYDYINLHERPEVVQELLHITNGIQNVPVIVLGNGKVLIEPSNEQLKTALNAL